MKYQIFEYTPHDGTDAWTLLYDSGNFYSGSSERTLPTFTWDGYNFDVTIAAATTDSEQSYYLGYATVRVSAATSSHDYKIYHTKDFTETQQASYPAINITSDGWDEGVDRSASSAVMLPKNLSPTAGWVWVATTPHHTDYHDSISAIFVIRNPVTHTHLPLFDPAAGLLMRGASQILRDE